jgi:hypothetical protein
VGTLGHMGDISYRMIGRKSRRGRDRSGFGGETESFLVRESEVGRAVPLSCRE